MNQSIERRYEITSHFGSWRVDVAYRTYDARLYGNHAIEGRPFVVPTNYARAGKQLLIQASAAGRMLNSMAVPVSRFEICISLVSCPRRASSRRSRSCRSVVRPDD